MFESYKKDLYDLIIVITKTVRKNILCTAKERAETNEIKFDKFFTKEI